MIWIYMVRSDDMERESCRDSNTHWVRVNVDDSVRDVVKIGIVIRKCLMIVFGKLSSLNKSCLICRIIWNALQSMKYDLLYTLQANDDCSKS